MSMSLVSMPPTKRGTFSAALACAILGAAATRLALAGTVRRLLAVHFAHASPELSVAVGVWLHNAKILIGVAAFIGSAQFVQRSQSLGRVERMFLRAGDIAVLLWASTTAALAGVLIGAYGDRQLRAFFPHGPVELAAWALLVALYVDVRRGRVTVTATVRRFVVILALLAVAAILELWAGG